jgi:hypothetical protein
MLLRPRTLSRFDRPLRVVALGLLSAFMLPCGFALAQTPPGTADNSFDTMLRAAGLKAKTAPMPDFVTKSRPDTGKLNYIPVGGKHPERPVKVMTPAEIAATTAELDATRVAQQRRAGVKPVPVPDKPTKSDKKSAAK